MLNDAEAGDTKTWLLYLIITPIAWPIVIILVGQCMLRAGVVFAYYHYISWEINHSHPSIYALHLFGITWHMEAAFEEPSDAKFAGKWSCRND